MLQRVLPLTSSTRSTAMMTVLGRRSMVTLTNTNSRTLSQLSLCSSANHLWISKRYKAVAAPSTNVDAPSSSTSATGQSSRVDVLVDGISRLTLLETADLIQQLKTRLNIKETLMAAPMAAMPATSATAANASAAPAEAEKPAEKTEFTLKLEKFDAAAKAKVIREIKGILPGANLVEAKKFVESAPKVIREHVPKDEAEKIKKALEAVGAVVIME